MQALKCLWMFQNDLLFMNIRFLICRKKWIDSWYQIWSKILDIKKKFSCYKILAVCHWHYIMSHLTMTYCNVMQCKSHNRQLQFVTFWTGRVILYREASQGEESNPSAEVTHSTDTAGLFVTYLLILSVLFILPTHLPFKTDLPSHLLIVMELSIQVACPQWKVGTYPGWTNRDPRAATSLRLHLCELKYVLIFLKLQPHRVQGLGDEMVPF